MKKIYLLILFSFSIFKAYSQFSEKKIISHCEMCNPTTVFGEDLDADGDIDVIATYDRYSDSRGAVVWYENDGKGSFSEPNLIFTASWLNGMRSIFTEDLDNDGEIDILIAAGPEIVWFENEGKGKFSELKLISGRVQAANSVYAADLDNDGDTDVLSASIQDNKIAWYENDGKGNFLGQKLISTKSIEPKTVYAKDLDGDEDIDVLSASQRDDKIAWYENDGKGNFSEEKVISSQANYAQTVYAADLDNDGDSDILSASGFDNKIAWHENDGKGNFSEEKLISSQVKGASSSTAIDLDGDSDFDVIATSWFDREVVWFENLGGNNFSEKKIITSYNGCCSVIHGKDLNGDGNQDVLASINDNEIVWFSNLIDFNTISGSTFWDKNNNSFKDNLEKGLNNFPIEITPNAIEKHTNDKGDFRFFIPNGTYTVTAMPDSCWALTIDSSSYTLVVNETSVQDVNFGFQLTSDYKSTQVRINSSPTRCGFLVPFFLSIENDGCSPIKGMYGLIIDPLINIISFEIEPHETRGDTLFWNYEELIAAETKRVKIIFQISNANFIGELINLKGLSYIENEQGELKLSSVYDYKSEIRCAYDPNDKLVSPNRLEDYDQNYTLFDESLEYTIRFQNTGNDTAFNVVIGDNLDENLDWSTFKPILASHPFETLLYKDGLVEFSFKNILLPDSTTNEPLSHGFVTYKIVQKKDLPENTVIENTAGIYFDFNPPIITNTTMNVLVSELPKTTSVSDFALEQTVKVYPNPFGDFLTIEQESLRTNELSRLSVFDVAGREVQSTILKDATQQISTAHLANGLYFYQVVNADGQMIANGKVIKY